MFPILITQFYGNLSIVGVHHPPQLKSLFLNSGEEILSLNSTRVFRITLVGICHLLIILLSFMHISKDRRYYWHLVGIKKCVVYFALSFSVEVACKGLSLMQHHSKEQGQTIVSDHSQHCSEFKFNFRVYNHNFHSIFLN